MRLGKKEGQIFLFCWICYAMSYLCKTNLSIVVPSVMEEFTLSKAQMGVVSTVFFWTYSIGQLICGSLGDRFSPKKMISCGLIGTSIANMLVGFLQNYGLLIVVWGINGIFLSMLWAPIVRIVSIWFSTNYRKRIGFLLNLTMIAGYFISWGAIGGLTIISSWRWAFWCPAVLIGIFCLIWMKRMEDQPERIGYPNYNQVSLSEQKGHSTISMRALIKKEHLWMVGLIAAMQGFIKEGIVFWAPTIIQEVGSKYQMNLAVSNLVSIVIPLMGIAGVLFAGWLMKRGNHENRSNQIMMAFSAVVCIVLIVGSQQVVINAVGLGVLSALMFGINTLVSTIIPLKFDHYHKVASVTGFLNFCCYMGATASGVLCGAITDCFGWSGLYMTFFVISILSVFFIRIDQKIQLRRKEYVNA